LPALIEHAKARGGIHVVNIRQNSPIISHLLSEYGSFLFFKASIKEVLAMKNILAAYEAKFGQAGGGARIIIKFG